MKSKILVLLMSMMLVVSITACSNNDSKKSSTDTTKEQASSTAGENEKSKTPITIKMMANLYEAELKETDIAFLKAIEEKTNVKLEIEIPPSSGYAEKLQLMLVSGEYPDVIMFQTTDSNSFKNALEGEVIIPLDEYLNNTPNLMKYTYDASWKAAKSSIDGKIYGVPRTSVTRADGFWFREDWLDKVGITIPDNGEITIDEFTEIMKRFTKDDPDGNGANDTYGIGVPVDTDKVMSPVLVSQFGDLGWQKADGEFNYISAQYDKNTERYKKVLSYTRQLYLDGMVNPDSAINDMQATRENFWRGTTGAIGDFGGNYTQHMEELGKINGDAKIVYAFVKNEAGEVKGTGYGTGMWQFWSISSTCKYPERVMEVMDYALSDEGYDMLYAGMEGVDYDDVDGKRVYREDIQNATFRGLFLRRSEDANFFIKPHVPQEQKDIILPILEKSVASVVRSEDMGYVPPTSKEPSYMDYMATMAEVRAKILLGELEVDAYDDLLTGWYENDGQRYVEEMNEYIANQK